MAEMKPHLAITVSDVDRSWVHDPDGTPWEVFTVLEDVEHDPDEARPPVAKACCA